MVGLKNVQNNCFMNAVIHCLRACDFLEILNLNSNFNEDWFQHMVALLVKTAPNSQDLLKFMNGFFEDQLKTNKHFVPNIQADAQEFLLNVLSNIQLKTTNDFNKTFTISIEDKIQKSCQKHNSVVVHNDFMLNLKIDELKMKGRINVENLIQKYFETEQIDCKCEICKTHTALKSKTLTGFPINLIVVLNIFKFQENICSKITRYVELTNELNMLEYYSDISHRNHLKYYLKSVCFHQGSSINSGHYTSK